MSVIATALKHLMAAGVTGDDLLVAVAEIESALTGKRSSGAERTARWRAKRHGDVTPVTGDVEKKVSDKEIPHTPLEINFQENNYSPREGGKSDEELAFEAWNDLASQADLPKAQVLTAERRRKLKARLAECGGIDGWHGALAKIRGSPWCRGENDRGWRADLDFVLQSKSFTRLMEGSYDGRSPGRHEAAGGVNSRSENERILASILAEAKRREDGEGDSDLPGFDARAA